MKLFFLFFREAFKNIYDILAPGGEFLFTAFEEMPIDQALEKLDEGKWSKYEHFKVISPTFKSEDALNYYKEIASDVGFGNCRFYRERHFMDFTEEMVNSKYWL